MSSNPLFKSLFILPCLLLLLPATVWAGGDDWRPVGLADLALKAPVVEKDADAEAIFWEVKVSDEFDGGSLRTVFNHYLRIKIFTERGRESQSRIDIPYFKPAIVSRREALFLTAATRKYPMVLESRAFSETVRFKLPAGFEVDEMPDAIALDASFGSYMTTYEVKDGELFFTRKLAIRAGTIPANQYESVRTFYQKIRAAEQSPVVLARK
jgi:hypothetical protein